MAVIRVSGQAAGLVLDEIAFPRPRARYAALRDFLHPATREILDRGIALWFPAPASFTGEDVAELHAHGGKAGIAALLSAIGSVSGCRLAEPGEFARRAFEHGKIDLAEAEGLADLIDAETEAQRRHAMHQAGGALSKLYEDWRRALIGISALVEASMDFSDEADVAADAMARAHAEARNLAAAMDRHLNDGHRGEILRSGFRVVIAGPPNAGKSSLMNALARREVAIVSEEAGTTRDVVEVRLDLGGLPVILSDTAGIREAASAVEREGVRRAFERARAADLVLWLTEARAPSSDLLEDVERLSAETIAVRTKIDLIEGENLPLNSNAFAISTKTGKGLDALLHKLMDKVTARIGTGEEPAVGQARHRAHLEDARQALRSFLELNAHRLELRAEDLRRAGNALGRITGRVDPEEVLGQIFQRFCIGK